MTPVQEEMSVYKSREAGKDKTCLRDRRGKGAVKESGSDFSVTQ